MEFSNSLALQRLALVNVNIILFSTSRSLIIVWYVLPNKSRIMGKVVVGKLNFGAEGEARVQIIIPKFLANLIVSGLF